MIYRCISGHVIAIGDPSHSLTRQKLQTCPAPDERSKNNDSFQSIQNRVGRQTIRAQLPAPQMRF